MWFLISEGKWLFITGHVLQLEHHVPLLDYNIMQTFSDFFSQCKCITITSLLPVTFKNYIALQQEWGWHSKCTYVHGAKNGLEAMSAVS